MSHVIRTDVKFRDLDCLKKAAEKCGLVFKENQKTWKWYSVSVGDYPVPDGWCCPKKKIPGKKVMGECEHALAVDGGKSNTYEVGIYREADGSWGIIFDFYAGGYGLQEHLGGPKDAKKLVNEYALQVAQKTATMQGWAYNRQGDSLTIYHPDGGTLTVGQGGVEAQGFIGSACTAPSKLLSEALGKEKDCMATSEYYDVAQNLTVTE